MPYVRLVVAVVFATAAGFHLHVLYGRGWAQQYVQTQAALGRLNNIAHEPYPWDVYLAALATAALPTFFQVWLFLLVREKLPGSSGVTKGFWFGLLLLAIGDTLIRLPIMSVLVGNPMDVMLVQSAEGWAIGLVKGVLIGLLAPPTLNWRRPSTAEAR